MSRRKLETSVPRAEAAALSRFVDALLAERTFTARFLHRRCPYCRRGLFIGERICWDCAKAEKLQRR